MSAYGKKRQYVEQASVYLTAVFKMDIRVRRKNEFWYGQTYLVRKVKNGLVVDTQPCKSVLQEASEKAKKKLRHMRTKQGKSSYV